MMQTVPQQIYIDVESHEMVDVADSKGSHYPSPTSFLPDAKVMSRISEAPISESQESRESV